MKAYDRLPSQGRSTGYGGRLCCRLCSLLGPILPFCFPHPVPPPPTSHLPWKTSPLSGSEIYCSLFLILSSEVQCQLTLAQQQCFLLPECRKCALPKCALPLLYPKPEVYAYCRHNGPQDWTLTGYQQVHANPLAKLMCTSGTCHKMPHLSNLKLAKAGPQPCLQPNLLNQFP